MDAKEKLAEYAHEAWAGWMKYLFSKSTRNDDGTITISPRGYVDALDRQISLRYQQLTDTEKELDRVESDKILAAIADCGTGGAGFVSDGYHTFDELYEYRKLYNAALANEWARNGIRRHLFDIHKSTRHSDGEECFGGGWFVVVANLPTGQISSHYKMEDFHLFKIPEREKAAEWDGHTPQQAAERLRKFLEFPV